MTKYGLWSCAAVGLLFSTAYAGTMGSPGSSQDLKMVGSLALGSGWASGGRSEQFYLTPQIEKRYVEQENGNAFAMGEVLVGVEKALSSAWLGQLGLAWASANPRIGGEIWDDADAQFNNLSYRYKLWSNRLGVKGVLLLDRGYWAMPYVSASAGVAFNRASFSNAALITEAIPNENFAKASTTGFSYGLGVGLNKAVSKSWRLGVGYEFSDWGKSHLGRAAGQTLNSGLSRNHFYSNGVLFQVTYVAQGGQS